MAKLRETTDEIASLAVRVTVLETKASLQEVSIISLLSEVKLLKEHANERDQYGRLNALHTFNIPGSDLETGPAACVYDTVLKPILAAAKPER